jgi:preprotein translocase subunit SecF
MLGFFSITGIEFDLNVLAAILALIGHSLNDTIVVFDRVREVFRSARKLETIEVFDKAINSTLSRTIMTSVTTLFAVVAMYFFGGPVLHGFSICLIVGIFLGTASSILFACPILLLLGTNKRDLVRPEQDPRLAAMP